MPATDIPADLAMHLDSKLCFAVHAASRAFDGLYRVTLRQTGLTYPQYLVMLVLWEHGELSIKQLGDRLRLDSGTLSPLVKRLEAAGLVVRQRAASDERSVMAHLTEAGLAMRAKVSEISLETALAGPTTTAAATSASGGASAGTVTRVAPGCSCGSRPPAPDRARATR